MLPKNWELSAPVPSSLRPACELAAPSCWMAGTCRIFRSTPWIRFLNRFEQRRISEHTAELRQALLHQRYKLRRSIHRLHVQLRGAGLGPIPVRCHHGHHHPGAPHAPLRLAGVRGHELSAREGRCAAGHHARPRIITLACLERFDWQQWSSLGGRGGSTPNPRNCLPSRLGFGSAPTRERFSARHQYLHDASIARLANPWVRKSMAACLILR